MTFKYSFGSTSLSPDDRTYLKNKNITTMSDLNAAEEDNITSFFGSIKKKDLIYSEILTSEFIFKSHLKMFNKVWKWAGKTRKTDKNIGISWFKITSDLQCLLDDTSFWIKNDTYSKDEICARFHHRLLKIHCFDNGNGRHGRIVTNLLLESLKQDHFTWGTKTMAPDIARIKYIQAMRLADERNYNLLLDIIRK